LHVCCKEPAGVDASTSCDEPDYIFASTYFEHGGESLHPLGFAPHFLTSQFGGGQQELLTAGLITKFNVHGQKLNMELTGVWDLGDAGTRFEPRETPDEFPHYLGAAWGNMFLDCDGEDADNVMCEASMEKDRSIGRNPVFFGTPMFSCSGEQDNGLFPIHESGKSCFSEDMETAEANGCSLIAAAGPCDEVCVSGLCGVNNPPIENRVTRNVIHVYLSDYTKKRAQQGRTLDPAVIAVISVLSTVLFCLLIFFGRKLWIRTSERPIDVAKNPTVSDDEENNTAVEESSASIDEALE
jgi:hypothetical protein